MVQQHCPNWGKGLTGHFQKPAKGPVFAGAGMQKTRPCKEYWRFYPTSEGTEGLRTTLNTSTKRKTHIGAPGTEGGKDVSKLVLT